MFCVWTAEALPRGDGEERFVWARVVGMLRFGSGVDARWDAGVGEKRGRVTGLQGLNRARMGRWSVDEKGNECGRCG